MTFIGAIIVISIISSALGGGNEETSTNTNGDTKVTEKKETVYKVKDVIKADQLEITVSKFEEKAKVRDQYVKQESI